MTADPWAIITAVFPQAPAEPQARTATYSVTAAGHPYAASALEQESQRVVDAQVGGRNHALNTAAFNLGQLVAGGALGEDDVVDSLLHASRQAGLDDVEAKRTIASGLKGGYDQPRGVPETPDVDDWLSKALSAEAPPPGVDPETGEVTEDAPPLERTSWWPRDLAGLLAGEVEEEPPAAFLARSDGHRLFYAGKVNALIGESESGKTWVGLIAVVQALAEGRRVLILDFEDTLAGVAARLRSLGATDDHLARLTYISPDEGLDLPQKRDLGEALRGAPPELILFDGVNAAMTLLGLDLEKNKDATSFSLQLLRPLKKTGACLVTIDHVTKSKDNRGSYAIGAQAKRADIDGCALMVEVTQPFGRGMTGRLKLTVSKDRPGHVRAVSADAKNAGTAVLISSDDGTVSGFIDAPDLRPAEERGPFRPTVLMERVSRYLEAVPADSEGVSNNAVAENVEGSKDTHRGVPYALDKLVEEGFAARVIDRRGHKHNRIVRPYRQSEDPMCDLYVAGSPTSPRVPHTSPTGDATGSPTPPPPYRGGEGDPSGASPGDDEPESWWNR